MQNKYVNKVGEKNVYGGPRATSWVGSKSKVLAIETCKNVANFCIAPMSSEGDDDSNNIARQMARMEEGWVS